MSCTIYTVSCNFAIHATCSLALMTYKYNELQMSFTIQKLSYKVSCKTPFFLITSLLIGRNFYTIEFHKPLDDY
jgi:hypothetical protein